MQNATFKRNLEWEERVFSISMDKSGTLMKRASSRTITSREHVEYSTYTSGSLQATPTQSTSCSQKDNINVYSDDLCISEEEISLPSLAEIVSRVNSSVKSVDDDAPTEHNANKSFHPPSSSLRSTQCRGRKSCPIDPVFPSSKAEGVSRSMTNDRQRVVVVVKNLTIVKQYNNNDNKDGDDQQQAAERNPKASQKKERKKSTRSRKNEHNNFNSQISSKGVTAAVSGRASSQRRSHIKVSDDCNSAIVSNRSASQAIVQPRKTTFQKELVSLVV